MDGSVSDVESVRSVDGAEEFEKEALRVVGLMPNWIPAEDHGEKIKTSYVLPFSFKKDTSAPANTKM